MTFSNHGFREVNRRRYEGAELLPEFNELPTRKEYEAAAKWHPIQRDDIEKNAEDVNGAADAAEDQFPRYQLPDGSELSDAADKGFRNAPNPSPLYRFERGERHFVMLDCGDGPLPMPAEIYDEMEFQPPYFYLMAHEATDDVELPELP